MNFLKTLGAAGVLLGAATASQATVLTQGSLQTTNITSPYALTGTLVASSSDTFNSGFGLTGSVTSWVVSGDTSNPLNGLTFIYQVNVTTDDLSQLSLYGYTGSGYSPVNVADTAGSLSLLPGSLSGGGAPTSTDWSGQLHFSFDPVLNAPGWTELLVVDTSAPSWTSVAFSSVQDGSAASVTTLAPIPEPATMSLLALGFALNAVRVVRKGRAARI